MTDVMNCRACGQAPLETHWRKEHHGPAAVQRAAVDRARWNLEGEKPAR